MAGKGVANLYYLHRAPPRVSEETPENSHVRMRVCDTPLPLFEGLAAAGSNMRESASSRAALAEKVSAFKESSSAALEDAIGEHARNFHSGFYKYDDPGSIAQKRQIGILSVAIYLTNAVDTMWEHLGRMDDAGTSALFEAALDNISRLLAPGFNKRTSEEFGRGFEDLKCMLDSSMNVLGMTGRVMDVFRIVESNVPELIDRTKEHFRKISE
jgi:hypothetical protein